MLKYLPAIVAALQHQPDSAHHQLVQRLILSGLAALFGKKPREAFAGRGEEYDVRAFVTCRALYVCRSGFAPSYRRLVPVEIN
jgi:hypothetical protein